MRPIDVKDSNSTPIFEGDLLTIDSIDKLRIDPDFIDILNVDKITVEVDSLCETLGVQLFYKFYKEDKLLTYQDFKDITLKEIKKALENGEINNDDYQEGMKEQEAYFSKLDLSKHIDVKIQSWDSSGSFYQGFVHQDKTVIESKLSDKEKEEALAVNLKDLVVNWSGISHTQDQELLVKMTPEVKEKAIKIHNSLYQASHGFKGDFTHLILKLKNISLSDLEYEAYPVYLDRESDFGMIDIDSDLYRKTLKPFREKFHKEIQAVLDKKAEKKVEDKEAEDLIGEASDKFKEKEAELMTDISCAKFMPIEKIFLGLTTSLNLITFFQEAGCEITVQDKK